MNRWLLLGVLIFNAGSAIGGGLALMTGWIPAQPAWVEHTDFAGLYFPGVILMAIVGGSALVAALAVAVHAPAWQLASLLSAVVMLIWIVGEVASIRAVHWLQAVYVVTPALVVWWTTRRTEPAVPPAVPVPRLPTHR
ncbi:MAG: hypothetical protein ABIQ15_06105 [Nocardioides sp.]